MHGPQAISCGVPGTTKKRGGTGVWGRVILPQLFSSVVYTIEVTSIVYTPRKLFNQLPIEDNGD